MWLNILSFVLANMLVKTRFAKRLALSFVIKFGKTAKGVLWSCLIISYMLKDRIKELMRYYFAHKVGSRFFDNKASIRYKDISLGWLKEGVDFISESKVPDTVMDVRRQGTAIEMEESMQDEHVMLYRKSIHINRKMLDEITFTPSYGIWTIRQCLRACWTRTAYCLPCGWKKYITSISLWNAVTMTPRI